MIVRARAPLRLGLGGGGTDVAPYCDRFGGLILNATISKYAYASVHDIDPGRILFVAADAGSAAEYDVAPYLEPDGHLDLHKGVYNTIVRRFNGGRAFPLQLTTSCDAPPGSGLGSSSTLVVAMLQALAEYRNVPLGEYDLAHIAYQVERIELGLSGGKQDQYAAAFGGFNFMEFYKDDRVIVNPLRIKNWVVSELEASTVLFFTGVSRASAAIIDEQRKNVNSGNQDAIEAMHRIRDEAVAMKEFVLKGDLKGFASAMQKGWEAKKRMAHNITNADIDEIADCSMRAGAYACKVSGAGGGGFMIFFMDPVRRPAVIAALRSLDRGQVIDCHFTKNGVQTWRVGC